MTSLGWMMPRSPWLASPGWTKKAGVPVEASVAAILRPTWPDLPMPVTMTRPRAAAIRSTAAANASPRPLPIASMSTASPARSVASVRSAEAMLASTASSSFGRGRAMRALYHAVPTGASPAATPPNPGFPVPDWIL